MKLLQAEQSAVQTQVAGLNNSRSEDVALRVLIRNHLNQTPPRVIHTIRKPAKMGGFRDRLFMGKSGRRATFAAPIGFQSKLVLNLAPPGADSAAIHVHEIRARVFSNPSTPTGGGGFEHLVHAA